MKPSSGLVKWQLIWNNALYFQVSFSFYARVSFSTTAVANMCRNLQIMQHFAHTWICISTIVCILIVKANLCLCFHLVFVLFYTAAGEGTVGEYVSEAWIYAAVCPAHLEGTIVLASCCSGNRRFYQLLTYFISIWLLSPHIISI